MTRTLTLMDEVALDFATVWPVIGDFGGIRNWAKAITEEKVEDTPEGKVRVLTMPNGAIIREGLVSSDANHYTYTLDRADMAFYNGTVAARPIDGGTRIELSVAFVPAEGVELKEATEKFLAFLGGNMRAMQRALGVA